MLEIWKKLKPSNVFSSFIVNSTKYENFSSNNSMFVGQLYEDKSLALRARDLIFKLNNSLLEPTNFLFMSGVYNCRLLVVNSFVCSSFRHVEVLVNFLKWCIYP